MYNLLVITAGLVLCVCTRVLCDPLCLEGDFDAQLRTILRNQMLNKHQVAELISRPLVDVRNTLNKQWKSYEVFPFGSLTTGLGLLTSDVDYYIRIPNYNASMDHNAIERTVQLFKEQPELYSRFSYQITDTHTVFTLFYIPTQQLVDIVYKFGDIGVANSKMIKYYYALDKRFLPLGGIIKIWAGNNQVTGDHNRLPNYGLYLLIIFYLQQKNLVPSVFELQKHSKTELIKNWDFSFNKVPYNSTNTENMYQLIGGFFKYYSEFNFTEFIVSPFAGYPIHRSAFVGLDNIPQEFSLYKFNLGGKHKMQPGLIIELNVDTDLCIQDAFEHNVNNGQRITHEEALKFINHIKLAAKMFEEIPKDKILKAIFSMDQQNESIPVDKLRKLRDCVEMPA